MAALIVGIIAAIVVVIFVARTVRIVPQARAGNVERLGRYIRTLQPGLNIVIPFVDRVRPLIDIREQVVSFEPQSVITEDNLSVNIDTVLYYQVTNPRDAAYEIGNFIQAIEKLTATTLRNVIGSLDLEKVLVSREHINSTLRGVLDDASGKWGIRVTRVELKEIEPPPTIRESMEKQMRADREKRAAILNAEGVRQSRILTAQGERQAAILKAEGQSKAIDTVFSAVHRNDPDPKLLAYQYLQVLPELAKGDGNTFWVIPSEVTQALQGVSQAFGQQMSQGLAGLGATGLDGSGQHTSDGRASGNDGAGGQDAVEDSADGQASVETSADGQHAVEASADGQAAVEGDESQRDEVAAALAEAAQLGQISGEPAGIESQLSSDGSLDNPKLAHDSDGIAQRANVSSDATPQLAEDLESSEEVETAQGSLAGEGSASEDDLPSSDGTAGFIDGATDGMGVPRLGHG
jgi:regulator of protease activity HflC (stomatin/prohibitin superfamily)